MSTQFGDTKRTLGTGDLVISVNEIFERLRSKVDSDTLEQLLRDIIAGRRNRVRPGELITAELINQVLADLESLETRVTKLEAGVTSNPTTPGNPAVITKVADSVQLDHNLEIHGRNFGFSKGAQRVSVDGVSQNEYQPGSSDELLIVKIRDIAGVIEQGKPVQLVVSNGIEPPATRSIRILPSQPLGGSADLTIGDPVPATIVLGSTAPVNFNCQITSQATLKTTFTVSARIDGVANSSDWTNRIEVLNASGGPITPETFALSPRQTRNFLVRLTSVPASVGATQFTLRLTANSGAAGGTVSRDFRVGENVPEDLVNIPVLQFESIDNGAINVARDTISVRTGQQATVTLRAEFATGGEYGATLQLESGGNWELALNEPVPKGSPTTGSYQITLPASGARVPKNPEILIRPQNTATSPGVLILRLKRSDLTISRSIKFTLLRVNG